MGLHFLGLTLKDWIIAVTLVILVFCIKEIKRLKKSIAREVQKRLAPQLILELIPGLGEKAGFYLNNESPFLVRDIEIKDVEFPIEDFGFMLDCILRFERIEYLKPHEKVKLAFTVLNTKQEHMDKLTDAAVPHLVSPSFKVKVVYSNIENLRFYVVFSKKKERFYLEEFDQLTQPSPGPAAKS